jgi:hypothetical protein
VADPPPAAGWFQDSALNFTIATDVKLSQSGPLTAPNLAGATAPGPGSYNRGPWFVYPDTYDTGGAPAYWVDLEVRPTSAPAPPQAPQHANSNAFLAFF